MDPTPNDIDSSPQRGLLSSSKIFVDLHERVIQRERAPFVIPFVTTVLVIFELGIVFVITFLIAIAIFET